MNTAARTYRRIHRRTIQTIRRLTLSMLAGMVLAGCASLPTASPAPAKPAYDEALAKRLGADDLGMRWYVFVLLKTGPKRMPDGPARQAMFRGHFDNIQRMSQSGQLVQAGPFDGVDGWRGLYLFNVKTIDEAKALVETDPVVTNGEMVAEYHRVYQSAALPLLKDLHATIAKKSP